jgi:hypothetical protein
MTPAQWERLRNLIEQVEDDEVDEWLDRLELELQFDLTGYLQHRFGETRSEDDFLAWQVEMLRLDQMMERLHRHDRLAD